MSSVCADVFVSCDSDSKGLLVEVCGGAAIDSAPLDIVIAVDNSHSMRVKLDSVKEALLRLFAPESGFLHRGDSLRILTFHNNVRWETQTLRIDHSQQQQAFLNTTVVSIVAEPGTRGFGRAVVDASVAAFEAWQEHGGLPLPP